MAYRELMRGSTDGGFECIMGVIVNAWLWRLLPFDWGPWGSLYSTPTSVAPSLSLGCAHFSGPPRFRVLEVFFEIFLANLGHVASN